MNPSVEKVMQSMFADGGPSVVADFLESKAHDNASVVRAMSDPVGIVRLLAGDVVPLPLVFQLPIPPISQLDIALRHGRVDDRTLFGFAVDFAEHVLPIYEQWNEHDSRPRDALAAMRKWIEGSTHDEELREARRNIEEGSCQPPVVNAIRAARKACNPWAWADHCVARYNAFDTAAAARDAAGTNEIEWQVSWVASRLTS